MKDKINDFATKVAKLQQETALLDNIIRKKELNQYMQLVVASAVILIVAFLLFSISPGIVQYTKEKTTATGMVKNVKCFSWFRFILWTVLLSGIINSGLYFSHIYGYINYE